MIGVWGGFKRCAIGLLGSSDGDPFDQPGLRIAQRPSGPAIGSQTDDVRITSRSDRIPTRSAAVRLRGRVRCGNGAGPWRPVPNCNQLCNQWTPPAARNELPFRWPLRPERQHALSPVVIDSLRWPMGAGLPSSGHIGCGTAPERSLPSCCLCCGVSFPRPGDHRFAKIARTIGRRL